MRLGAVGAAVALTGPLPAAAVAKERVGGHAPANFPVRHRRLRVGGVEIFYREAGNPKLPTLLLLHGFPSSSHMFRNLLPALSDRFHLIAPDYPGFGFSEFPERGKFAYSFERYAALMVEFVDALGIGNYGLYVQDYGAPIGFRLALLRPKGIRFLIVQNGNTYEEGFSTRWAPLKAYWREPTAKVRDAIKGSLGLASTMRQYVAGLSPEQAELVSPELWTLDWERMSRPDNIDLQVDLFGDYGDNVRLFPQIQAYFRQSRLPTLIAWGARDPIFTVEGARAYLRDLPEAELHLLDGSHFLLETHGGEVAHLIRDFTARHRL